MVWTRLTVFLESKIFFSVQQFSFFGCGKKNLGGLRKPLQVQNKNYANENEQKINAAPKNAITVCKKTKYPTLADLLKDEPIKPNVINIDITDDEAVEFMDVKENSEQNQKKVVSVLSDDMEDVEVGTHPTCAIEIN